MNMGKGALMIDMSFMRLGNQAFRFLIKKKQDWATKKSNSQNTSMNGTYTEPQQFDDDYAEIGEEIKAGCPLEE